MVKNKKTRSKPSAFDLIIRPKIKIKSRQWWKNQIIKCRKLIYKHLSKSKRKLSNRSNLTFLITNDKEIRDLNKRFRKKNKPTDVLSFHLNHNEQLKRKYLGDVVISTETATRDAKRLKVPVESELQMLIIHGYLHLLGFDHIRKKEAKIMFSMQNILLKEMLFY